MKVAIGADHRGFELKGRLKSWLQANGHEVTDVGAEGLNIDDDYPDYAYAAARLVGNGSLERAVLICGSGMGMDIVANKVLGVRAATVRTIDEAQYGRDDDDINAISLAADNTDLNSAVAIVKTFLETPFSGAERHKRRLDKVREIEHRLCNHVE